MTRQPNADELAENITFDAARAKEVAFFANTDPWRSLDLQWQKRLGTKNLTVSLSDQLMAFIKAKYVFVASHPMAALSRNTATSAVLPTGFPRS